MHATGMQAAYHAAPLSDPERDTKASSSNNILNVCRTGIMTLLDAGFDWIRLTRSLANSERLYSTSEVVVRGNVFA